MLRIDRSNKSLVTLKKHKLAEVGITERNDLQEMIKSNPDVFFAEMGESLLLIGDEVRPTDFVEDRIDLLAVDQQGALVVIELKRGSNKLQLLQALSYAGMISKWEYSQVVTQRQQLTGQSEEEVDEDIEQFLLQDVASLNDSQRMILVAEDFDYEVLVTAEWLSELYDVDIRCFRLSLSAEGEAEFLNCTCIYPPPEITKHATKRGRKGKTKGSKWSSWEDALKGITNQAITDFYMRELEAGRENYINKRILHYRVGGSRRFFVAARQKTAYVWQSRRFANDEAYWEDKIGEHIEIKPVKKKRALRFFLSKARDFEKFVNAIDGDLQTVEFFQRSFQPDNEDTEGDD